MTTTVISTRRNAPRRLFERPIVIRALKDSLIKLNPKVVAKNPVMFVVEVGSIISTYFFIKGLLIGADDILFVGQVSLWLWVTVIFANFAEAMAEGRGKAQADALRRTKTETLAKKITDGPVEVISATALRKGE